MSKIKFTKNQIEQLSKNKYVIRVSEKAITYSNEFKIHFIAEYEKGKSSRQIFEEASFDVDVIGIYRVDCASNRWRSSYNKHGILGLDDTRKNNSGRPLQRELTKDEIISRKNAEIEFLKAEVELLKKLELQERLVINGKIAASKIFKLIESIVQKLVGQNVIKYLCSLADVSRSGYYRYLNSKDIQESRELDDELVKNDILKAFKFKGYKKGSRSIKMTLQNTFGVNYNRKRIQRIMRKYRIICSIRKANPYKRIAKANKEHSVVPNLLNREFKQNIPGKVLLTDITYLPYSNSNMAYLSTIKDSSTNEILAYKVSDKITIDIALDTIKNLVSNTEVTLSKDAFVHSDQGSHYTSPKFQKLLKSLNIGQSMSRRGNCWDNAPQESFFGHMKDEVPYRTCQTLSELEKIIENYIDYYNNYRCQWNLKKLTPVQYKNQLLNI
ncbi:MAG: IS3 family transposase [Cetobacterium sp.]